MFGLFYPLLAAVILMCLSRIYPYKALARAAAVLPPLTLLQFIFIPIDLITSLVWMAAHIAVVVSVFTIVAAIIHWIFGPASNRKAVAFRLIRPTLTLLTFATAFTAVNWSVQSANAHALQQAFAIQRALQTGNGCGKAYSTVKHQSDQSIGNYDYRYGEYGTTYPIKLSCNVANQQFSVFVRVNQDSSFHVSGHSNEPLVAQYGHFRTPKKITITSATDLNQLAKMAL